MSTDLVQNLIINKVKELTKQRHFFCEFLVIDNEHQIVGGGHNDFYIGSRQTLTINLLQDLKARTLQNMQQEDDYTLNFSSKNILLVSIVELEDEGLETKKSNQEQERIAEFDERIAEFFPKFSWEERLACNIFIPKLFDVFEKLTQTPMPRKQQILDSEFKPILHYLPDIVQQALLDLFNKM